MAFKKIIYFIIIAAFLFNSYGCVAILAGAAGGVGTAFWLEGKLKEDVNASLPSAVEAINSAMKSLHLDITKTTEKDEVAQIIGNYTDGRTIWIDIHKLSEKTCRIQVRVGAKGDKEASKKILDRIKRYL